MKKPRGERKSSTTWTPVLSPLRGLEHWGRPAPGLTPWAMVCRPCGAPTRGIAVPADAPLALADRISERHYVKLVSTEEVQEILSYLNAFNLATPRTASISFGPANPANGIQKKRLTLEHCRQCSLAPSFNPS